MYTLLSPTAILSRVPAPDGVKRRIQALESIVFDSDNPITVSGLLAGKNVLRISQEHLLPMAISYVPFKGKIADVAAGGVRRLSDGFGIGETEVKDVVGVLSKMPLLRTELGASALNLVQQFAVEALKDVKSEQDLERAGRLLRNLAASLCVDKEGGSRIEEADGKKEEEDPPEVGDGDTPGNVVRGTAPSPDDDSLPAQKSNVGIHPTSLKLVKVLISCVPFNGTISRVTQGGVRTISGRFDLGHGDIHKALVMLGRLPLLRTQVGGAALGLVDHFTADALAPKTTTKTRKRIENHIHITIPTLHSSPSITFCDCSDASFILQDNHLVSTKPPCNSATCRRVQVNPSPPSTSAAPEIIISTPSASGSSSSVISIASSTRSTSTSRKSLSSSASSSGSSNTKGKAGPRVRARSNSGGPNAKVPRQHHSLLLTAEIAVLKCLHAMFDYSWALVVKFLGGFVTVVELVDEAEGEASSTKTKTKMKPRASQQGRDPDLSAEESAYASTEGVSDAESISLELEGKIPPSDSVESIARDEASDASFATEPGADERSTNHEHESDNEYAPPGPCDDDDMPGGWEDEEGEEEPVGFDEAEAWVPPPVIHRPIFTPKIDHAGRAYFSPAPGVRIPRTNDELARMNPELYLPGRGMSPMRLSEISPPGSRKYPDDEEEDDEWDDEYPDEEDYEREFDEVELDDEPGRHSDGDGGDACDDEDPHAAVDDQEEEPYERLQESEEIDEVDPVEVGASSALPSDPPTYSEFPTTQPPPSPNQVQRTSPSNNAAFRSLIPVASPARLASRITPIQSPPTSPPLSKAISELRANLNAEKMLRSPAVLRSPPRQEGPNTRLCRDGSKSPPSPSRTPAKDLPSKYFIDPENPASHKALPISTPLMDKYGARFKRAADETPASPSSDAQYFMQPSGGTSIISSRISPLSENESLPAQESPLDGRALRIAKARGDGSKLATKAAKPTGFVSPLPQQADPDLKLPKRTWEVYQDPSPTRQPSPTPSENLEVPDPKPSKSATAAANKPKKKNKNKKQSEANPPSKKPPTMKKKENSSQPSSTSTAVVPKKSKDKKAIKDKTQNQNQKPKEPARVLFPKYIEDLPNPIPPLPFRMPLKSKPTDTPPTSTAATAAPTSTGSTKTSSMSGVENLKPANMYPQDPLVALPTITINSPGSPAPAPMVVKATSAPEDVPDLVRAPPATEMLEDPTDSKHPAGLPVAKTNDDVHLKVVSHAPLGESPSDDGILDHFFKADQTDPAFFDMLVDKDMPREDSSFIRHSGDDDEECWDWDGIEAPDLSCWLGKALAAEKRDVHGPLTSTPLPEGKFGKGFKGKGRAVSLSPPPVSEYIPPLMERARSAPAPGGTPSSAPRIFRSALQPRPRPSGSSQSPLAGSSVTRALR